MIYCERDKKYKRQKESCKTCIFYDWQEDSCSYEIFRPGLKIGRNWEND